MMIYALILFSVTFVLMMIAGTMGLVAIFVKSKMPALSAVLVLLIAASFIENKPEITNGLICCGLLPIGLHISIFGWFTESKLHI